MPLYRADAMRSLELRAMHAHPEWPLMARAGEAAAQYALEIIAGTGRDVLVLAGPGNNGGDAFEVAAHLKRGFYRVDLLHLGDPGKRRGEAKLAWEKWQGVDGRTLDRLPADARYDLVVDGLFGIGLSKAIDGDYAAWIAAANAMKAPRLALDIPSGLHSDTGAVTGPALRATHTITFIAGKPGLHTLDGPDHCGELRLATLGLDDLALAEPEGRLLGPGMLGRLPLKRARNFHKGKAGAVAVIGGAPGMVGAALLAGRAALKTGAGKVFIGLLAEPPIAVDTAQPELMLRKVDAALSDAALTAVVAGPGMGIESVAQRVLSSVLRIDKPLLLDADALNLIAAYGVLQSAVLARKAPTLMTPHPAEAARLLEMPTAQVQADRIHAATMLAVKFKAIVVLKGVGSVCATPQGNWWINPSGNAGMASAGTGDVLSGLCGALLAQGVPAEEALLAAVYLHGAAGDAAAAGGAGPVGLTAQELIDPARAILNRSIA
jgi:ADP-dependent NAD(P)H-hydrate dehydratase / NAD(P)H-hydrate epimerase